MKYTKKESSGKGKQMQRRVFWNEPDDIVMSCTQEEAIERQKAAALSKGYVYVSDEEALEDFMVVHWAWTQWVSWAENKGET
jgi:hypothetical protein